MIADDVMHEVSKGWASAYAIVAAELGGGHGARASVATGVSAERGWRISELIGRGMAERQGEDLRMSE